jgi:endonuclease-3
LFFSAVFAILRALSEDLETTMKKQEVADRVSEMLEELYPEPPVPLDHTDGFTLLIAVLLSAQTTDARVNLVTPGLWELGRTPAELNNVSEEDILAAIKTCGLAPTKARNIKKLVGILVDDFAGEIPETLEELETLPGVGHKTASVVMAQWFGVPAFPVDTHIHRLARRWGLSSGKNVDQTEKDLKKVFPKDTWNRRHLQIIFFGREYCPSRSHDFDQCPICSWASSPKTRALEAKTNDKKKR